MGRLKKTSLIFVFTLGLSSFGGVTFAAGCGDHSAENHSGATNAQQSTPNKQEAPDQKS